MINAMTEDQIDFELEKMTNTATAARRQAMAKAQQADPIAKPAEKRSKKMKLFFEVAVRLGIGLVFLGAITRAWIEPVFGLSVAVACFVWAYGQFLRNRR